MPIDIGQDLLLRVYGLQLFGFAKSSTALGISPRSLVQQTLRTVSVVFFSLLQSHTLGHRNPSNHSVLVLQCSLVLSLPRVNALTTCVRPQTSTGKRSLW